MQWGSRWHVAGLLAVFAVIYILLCVSSYRGESATWDEPQHLTAGYSITQFGDYRIDPEHPPLGRAIVSLPLRFVDGLRPPATPIPDSVGTPWLMFHQFVHAHHWLYQVNDADRLLYSARLMMVLLGVMTGFLLF